MFKARKITFKSAGASMEYNDCRCMETRSVSGLTGLFISSKGTINVPSKSMADSFSVCMLRINPGELKAM